MRNPAAFTPTVGVRSCPAPIGRGRRVAKVLALLCVQLALLAPTLQASAGLMPAGTWHWPTGEPAPVSRAFDGPVKDWLPGHRGVDLQVPVDAKLLAPVAGRVIYAGDLAGRGVVSIEAANGIRSTYEPVQPLVSAGQMVGAGEPVATLAAGHDQNALHWGAKVGPKAYRDPLLFVLGSAVLKPWPG